MRKQGTSAGAQHRAPSTKQHRAHAMVAGSMGWPRTADADGHHANGALHALILLGGDQQVLAQLAKPTRKHASVQRIMQPLTWHVALAQPCTQRGCAQPCVLCVLCTHF